MILSEVKWIGISDCDFDNFDFNSIKGSVISVDIAIGPMNSDARDYFQAIFIQELVSDSFEGKRPVSKQYIWPKANTIVVSDFYKETIRSKIDNIVAQCLKLEWEDALSCLRKNFNWEYEGMADRKP